MTWGCGNGAVGQNIQGEKKRDQKNIVFLLSVFGGDFADNRSVLLLRAVLHPDRRRGQAQTASSTVCAVNSQLFLAGNLRQLEDFQFEVFTVSEAVCLPYQPSDLGVESFHRGVADMPKCPVTDNPVQFVTDRLRHSPQFGYLGFFGEAAPAVKCDPRMV